MQLKTVVFLLLLFTSFLRAGVGFAIDWEEQAERLQKVSATLLDGYPVGEPVRANLGVEAKAITSLLPEVKPTVGGKTEKVPSAPVHAVPTLQLNARFIDRAPFALGSQAWAGYLPAGGEKVFGIKASLSQYAYGFAVVPEFRLAMGINPYLSLGYQASKATLKGAITASDAEDEFTASTTFMHAVLGAHIPSSRLWFAGMLGKKTTESEFYISDDHTRLAFTDTLSDASLPYVQQIAAGYYYPGGLQLGIAEVFVPNRLLMPRFLFSVQYLLRP